MYPKAPDLKIQKLTDLLIKHSEGLKVQYVLVKERFDYEDIFSHLGGLGLFMIETKELYEKIYNKNYSAVELASVLTGDGGVEKIEKTLTVEDRRKDLEITDGLIVLKKFPVELVEQKDGTYFDFIVRKHPHIDISFSELAYITSFVVEDYCNKYKKEIDGEIVIPLDTLYSKMVHKINARKINIISEKEANLLYGEKPKVVVNY